MNSKHHLLTQPDIIRSCHKKVIVTVEYCYRVYIVTVVVDQQLQKLNNRLDEQTTELLILSSSLNPKDNSKHFNAKKICRLAKKYYSIEFFVFDEKDWMNELELYNRDVPRHVEMKNLNTISNLRRSLSENRRFVFYPLVDRLIRLILNLTVDTITTEHAFSAMKSAKTSLRNMMEDEFLLDYLTIYIKKTKC